MSQPPLDPTKIPETKQSTTSSDSTQPATLSSDYAPYPKLDPKDVTPPPENWANVSMGSQSQLNPGPAPISSSAATTMPAESNPYVSPAPVQSSSVKGNPLPTTPLTSVYTKLDFWILFKFKPFFEQIRWNQ